MAEESQKEEISYDDEFTAEDLIPNDEDIPYYRLTLPKLHRMKRGKYLLLLQNRLGNLCWSSWLYRNWKGLTVR